MRGGAHNIISWSHGRVPIANVQLAVEGQMQRITLVNVYTDCSPSGCAGKDREPPKRSNDRRSTPRSKRQVDKLRVGILCFRLLRQQKTSLSE